MIIGVHGSFPSLSSDELLTDQSSRALSMIWKLALWIYKAFPSIVMVITELSVFNVYRLFFR